MNLENTSKLFETFPDLYIQQSWSMSESAMSFGFECSNGWFDLIYNLSNELSQFDGLQACQVKEKFGGLRFYVNQVEDDYYNNVITDLISKAEEASYTICDTCGGDAKTTNVKGWVRTICEECKP